MRCYHCMREMKTEAPFCPYCGNNPREENAPHLLKAGTLLHERYLIGNTLGEGGFGITYVGHDQTLDLKVAVKEYYPAGIANRNNTASNEVTLNFTKQGEFYTHGKESFLREARSIAGFSRESGVVDVRDYFTENNTAYIVMEYLDGVNLREYLRQNGTLDVRQVFEKMLPLMRTLEKMHAAGVIHRDISPDNIMCLENGSVKLMDFGSARQFAGDQNKSLSVVLKPGFAPYEQYSRKGNQGPWTDIYTLCATIYLGITGKTPPDSLDRMEADDLLPPSSLGVAISPDLENTLMKGLAVYPENRLQSMGEMIRAAEKALKEMPKETPKVKKITDDNHTVMADPLEQAPPEYRRDSDWRTDPQADPLREKVVTDPNAGSYQAPPETVNYDLFVKRALLYAEEGNYQAAEEYCRRVQEGDPENAQVYLCRLLMDLRVPAKEDLANCLQPFDDNINYKRVRRFGDEALVEELEGYNRDIRARVNEDRYAKAVNMEKGRDYLRASSAFRALGNYRDAQKHAEVCAAKAEEQRKESIYRQAMQLANRPNRTPADELKAIELFGSVLDWKDAKQQQMKLRAAHNESLRKEQEKKARKKRTKRIVVIASIAAAVAAVAVCAALFWFVPFSKYQAAVKLYEDKKFEESIKAFQDCNGFLDSEAMIKAAEKKLPEGSYVKGKALFEEKKYPEAIKCFEESEGYKDSDDMITACYYNNGKALYEQKQYAEALENFAKCEDYSDSKDMITACNYQNGKALFDQKKYTEAMACFQKSKGYKDSDEMVTGCKYYSAGDLCKEGKYYEGIRAYRQIAGYQDALDKIEAARKDSYNAAEALYKKQKFRDAVPLYFASEGYGESAKRLRGLLAQTIDTGRYFEGFRRGDPAVSPAPVAVTNAGTVLNGPGTWKNIASVSRGFFHMVGLREDGTVVATWLNSKFARNKSYNHNQTKVDDWRDIVAIEAGTYYTIGVKADGTVLLAGYGGLSGATNCTTYSANLTINYQRVAGIRPDGTAYAVNNEKYENVVDVAEGYTYRGFLFKDGTVRKSGEGQTSALLNWTDIIAISAGPNGIAGLKSNGRVVFDGDASPGQINQWKNIVAVSCRGDVLVGLKSDGTVVYCSIPSNQFKNYNGDYSYMAKWKNIRIPLSAKEFFPD